MFTDILTTLSGYQDSFYIFISGSVLTRKKFWSIVFSVFAGMFGLYRLWLFIEALKDKRFRLFLMKILSIFTSFTAIILILFIFISCSNPMNNATKNTTLAEDENELLELSSTMLFSNSDFNDSGFRPDMDYKDSTSLPKVKLIIDLNKKLKAVSKRIASKKRLKNLKTRFRNNGKLTTNKDKFKLLKIIDVKGNIIACNQLKTSIILLNRKVSTSCKKYYRLLVNLSNKKKVNIVYNNIDLNECETFGWSFKLRIKSKMTHVNNRWNGLKIWNTRHIPLNKNSSIVREDTISLINKDVSLLKEKLSKHVECKNETVKDYFNSLYFGIIPGRKLN